MVELRHLIKTDDLLQGLERLRLLYVRRQLQGLQLSQIVHVDLNRAPELLPLQLALRPRELRPFIGGLRRQADDLPAQPVQFDKPGIVDQHTEPGELELDLVQLLAILMYSSCAARSLPTSFKWVP